MGTPDKDATGGEADPEVEGEAVPDDEAGPDSGNPIDVTPALHTAGHELEDLGFDGVADSAPVLHDDESDEVDFNHRMRADIATRGQDHH